MKIYFCDLCNESIPLEDLKDGKASTIKGKIFCRGCNPLNTVESSTTKSGVGVMLPIALFVVAAGLAGGAWFFAYQLMGRIDEMPRHDDALARLETRLDRAVQDVESITGSHKTLAVDPYLRRPPASSIRSRLISSLMPSETTLRRVESLGVFVLRESLRTLLVVVRTGPPGLPRS